MKNIDKLLHALVSAVIVFTVYAFTDNIVWSGLISMAVGIGKECYDEVSDNSSFDYQDILADVVGIMAAMFVLVVGN